MISPSVLVLALAFAPGNVGLPPSDPDYLITTWQTEQGLPENSATAMVQTPDGYLWFGTFGGLVRFDGVQFTKVQAPLPSEGVVSLHMKKILTSLDRKSVV